MSGIIAEDSRVNVLIRLVSVFVLALGIALAYMTNQGAASASLQPQVVPVYYLCSMILLVAGFLGFVSKYKQSSAPKPQ